MNIELNILGIIDLDEKFQDMMAVKHLCDKNLFQYPNEVSVYFKGMAYESESFLKKNLEMVEIPKKEYIKERCEGFEIDVKDIPSEVKTLRFFISC